MSCLISNLNLVTLLLKSINACKALKLLLTGVVLADKVWRKEEPTISHSKILFVNPPQTARGMILLPILHPSALGVKLPSSPYIRPYVPLACLSLSVVPLPARHLHPVLPRKPQLSHQSFVLISLLSLNLLTNSQQSHHILLGYASDACDLFLPLSHLKRYDDL